MVSQCKVSIIIPVFNVSGYIDDCVQSCLNQTHKNLQIIIVNDGSTDDCLIKIGNYASIGKRILIVDQNNQGVVSARKNGLERANGEFLFFLDGDDNLPKDSIENQINKIDSEGSDIVVDLNGYNSKFKTNPIKISSPQSVNDFLPLMFQYDIFVTGKLIKRKLHTTKFHHPIGLTKSEDTILFIQFVMGAKKISIVEKKTYNVVKREDSLSVTNQFKNPLMYYLIAKILNDILKDNKTHFYNLKIVRSQIILNILNYLKLSRKIANKNSAKEMLKTHFSAYKNEFSNDAYVYRMASLALTNVFLAKYYLKFSNIKKSIFCLYYKNRCNAKK